LWFFSISFALWAMVFAYQRYLIPLELLFGVALWILAVQIFRNVKLVLVVLAICVAASFTTLHVPDWGHTPAAKTSPNAFGLQLPYELVSQPADYLVYSKPISYIFPFLHPDSRFFRVDFSPRIDGLIRQALAHNLSHPVRVLTRVAEVEQAMTAGARFGYLAGAATRFCWHFHAATDSYVACEVQPSRSVQLRHRQAMDLTLDFRDATPWPPWVVTVTGLGQQELWG